MKNILRNKRKKKLLIYSRKLKSYTKQFIWLMLISFHCGLGIKAAINNVIHSEKWLMFAHFHRCINHNDLY